MTEQEAERLIRGLIYDYAHCIDDDRLEEWPGFFTEACFYQVISRDDYEQGLPAGVMTCRSRGMLVDRIVSLRNALQKCKACACPAKVELDHRQTAERIAQRHAHGGQDRQRCVAHHVYEDHASLT